MESHTNKVSISDIDIKTFKGIIYDFRVIKLISSY